MKRGEPRRFPGTLASVRPHHPRPVLHANQTPRCLLPEPAHISAAQHTLPEAGQTLCWAMNQTEPCPWAPGTGWRGETDSLINKLYAMLGRHVFQQSGELRAGSGAWGRAEPDVGNLGAPQAEGPQSGAWQGQGGERAVGAGERVPAKAQRRRTQSSAWRSAGGGQGGR